MPEHPREAQLHQDARRAFGRTLPRNWIYRDQPESDVGIDVTLRLTPEDRVTDESPSQWLADRIVVIEPDRLVIPAPSGEWTTFEFPLGIRNVLRRPIYDVGFAAVLGADTTLDSDRFQFLPQFQVNDTNLSPIGFTSVGTDSGTTYRQHKFQRMDAGTSYPFVVRYEANPNEEGEPATRTVHFRVVSTSDTPSPVFIAPA